MSTNAENDAGSSLDWLKWLVVGALLVAGVFGNWYTNCQIHQQQAMHPQPTISASQGNYRHHFQHLYSHKLPNHIQAAKSQHSLSRTSASFTISAKRWQARRESNPQPAVLETAALPIELLAFSPIHSPSIVGATNF